MLRTKFSLGLFENPYPYADYNSTIRTSASANALKKMDRESIVLLENRKAVLPLSKKSTRSVALIGPQMPRVSLGDYVFANASQKGITPLDGFKTLLKGTDVEINYAEGCKLWSFDESGFDEAVAAAKKSEVAIVAVGTWTLDQSELWGEGIHLFLCAMC